MRSKHLKIGDKGQRQVNRWKFMYSGKTMRYFAYKAAFLKQYSWPINQWW